MYSVYSSAFLCFGSLQNILTLVSPEFGLVGVTVTSFFLTNIIRSNDVTKGDQKVSSAKIGV